MDNITKYETETHSREFKEGDSSDIEQGGSNLDFVYNIKTRYRLLKKRFITKIKKKTKRNFKQVLYITIDTSPEDYITAFQKQYPDKSISVLIPVIRHPNLKPHLCFDFFMQNKVNHACLYKFPKNRDNIQIFGIYSPIFSSMQSLSDFSRLFYLAPFIKCARICALKLKPDIIHADNIPFFLGGEFEKGRFPIKVLQSIKDFSIYETNKFEPFWAAINLVDRKGMKRICRDKIIKKCIASLFNLHNTRKFYRLRECLEFIYQNYFKFRRYIDKCEDIDENILFSRMNARILKLFPQMAYEDDNYYNSMFFSVKKASLWAAVSKTYYQDLLENPQLTGKMFKRLKNTSSDYISYGANFPQYLIYQRFNSENFRELRVRNKKYLIKEFTKDKIKTRFVDRTLFKNEDYAIYGNLDSFYEAPLVFCTFTADFYNQGADIALNCILKLFEQYKNLQAIINIPDGLKNNYIKTWVEFLNKNSACNGRWVFIDGEINYPQFMSGSDIILLPSRINPTSTVHYEAMKYGCIPVASKCGIYNDTIADIFDDMVDGCGLKTKTALFGEENVNEIFLTALNKALNLYSKNPASWNLLIKNAINYNSGWSFDIIEKYNEIYNSL